MNKIAYNPEKVERMFFYTNDLAKQRIFSYHNSVVFFSASTFEEDAAIWRKNRAGEFGSFSFFVPNTNIYQSIREFNRENSVPQKTTRSHRKAFYY